MDGPQDGNLPRTCSNKFGKPDIDLFASRINCQLSNYTPWRLDLGPKAVNTFSKTDQKPIITLFYRLAYLEGPA